MCRAFAVKFWFRFICQNSLWSKCLLKKYCKDKSPGEVEPKSSDSPIWKRMIEVKSINMENTLWRSGEGPCYFWHDQWCEKGRMDSFNLSNPDSDTLLQDLTSNEDWNW